MPKRPSMQDRKQETQRGSSLADTVLMGQERARREVVELRIREIMPNRQQPRTTFGEASLDELAESIRLHGVLEPVIVREIPLTPFEGHARQYELIAGERRWRAATRAGSATIPALVLPEGTTDQATLELAITENLQREDLHPMDEAIAFGRMQRELSYSYTQIAERLGKSKGYVQNRMRLLQLDEDLQQLVAERPDTLSHVYELAKVLDVVQRQPLIEAVRGAALSLAETRAQVQALLAPPTARPVDTSYLRKYDREENHTSGDALPVRVDTSPTGEAAHAPVPALQSRSASLTPRERAALLATAVKVERYLDDLSLLTEEDWVVLSPLALRLSDLIRQVTRASDVARGKDSPDTQRDA